MRRKMSYDEDDDYDYGDDTSVNSQLMPEKEPESWNAFKDPPIKQTTGSMATNVWFDRAEKFGRLFAIVMTFIVVLGCAMVSKGTLLFITSQIRKNITRGVCNKRYSAYRQFGVVLPDVERVSWIWILCFIYWIPQAGTFIRSVRIIFFKSWDKPSKREMISITLTESLCTIGSAILVFYILPELDVIKGVMLTNAVCFIPAVIRFFSRRNCTAKSILPLTLDMLSMLAQAIALVVWPLLGSDKSLWIIIVSVIFISAGWWENFVSTNSPIPFLRDIVQDQFRNSRYVVYSLVSVWKSILFFCTMLVIFAINEGDVTFLFDNLKDAFHDHIIHIDEIPPIIRNIEEEKLDNLVEISKGVDIYTNYMTALSVFLINIATTYACYAFSKFACKVMIQRYSFAFPINLAVPATVTGLVIICGMYNGNNCEFTSTIPDYLFFEIPQIYNLSEYITEQYVWIWILWLLSQCWITIHIWSPKCEKLARTEVLFVRPMFHPFLIDQDIALNRRRLDREKKKIDDSNEDEDEEMISNDLKIKRKEEEKKDNVTRIYACGTMWHETTEEMMEFLKSVMRLDEDQHARKIVRDFMEVYDYEGYYEYETHVFFDDAFVRFKDDPEPYVNDFVKQLVAAVSKAATEVHGTTVIVRPPKKYITPYGGRLEWTLPGKTKMIAHLKDKARIRPKKRWSQVMYMYYLLGYRLMARDDLTTRSKDIRARNTYILALDGDIDFQPNALHLLVDLMKKNDTLGAACGRIHPIGSGPMVWYQMFEYAVGHWLQKATEHVIGCVLCSPGCFSLFRGIALMDDNVMAKYTTRSTEPMHYVQYDQGEDRWLCTLLLQRGYRVEYSAASDAFTHCPEKFNEFYNQRRRWMPSTTANILDLLMDAKRTIKVNDNISIYYIFYQMILMIGTVLGPGTIFLMLVGAFVAAFQTDQWTSFLLNCIPILIFMFVCFMFKSDKIQLFFAGLISAVYGLIMMAVLVGVMLQISNDGFLAPSSLFFFCVAAEFIITGLLHPKELNCLPYGIVYYVTVPSMYMLLVIYSVFNMNNVSWGTREVTVVQKPSQGGEEVKKPVEEPKKKDKNKIVSLLGKASPDNTGAIELSLSGLFKCLWCTHQKEPEENKELRAIKDSLELLMQKLDKVESQPVLENEPSATPQPTIIEGYKKLQEIESTNSETSGFDFDTNWINDEDLLRGEVDIIPTKETEFWKRLIDLYLHPIDDTIDKDRIQKGLIDLRDKAVFAFFMLNSLFVLVIFLLTLKKDLLHIRWPLDVKRNITYMEDDNEVQISNGYLELEPIGFVFLIFFAILLVVQFVAMIIHRFGTFSQIIATTRINFKLFSSNVEKMSAEEIQEDPLFVAKQLQKLKGDESDEEDDQVEKVGRRKTIHNLVKKDKKPKVHDLDQAVKRRLTKFENDGNYKIPVRRETMAALATRRRTIMQRRQSQGPLNARPSVFHMPTYDNEAFEDFA